MATQRYGLSMGEQYNLVTQAVGAAVSSDTVEVTVDWDAASNPKRQEVILALEAIINNIMNGTYGK